MKSFIAFSRAFAYWLFIVVPLSLIKRKWIPFSKVHMFVLLTSRLDKADTKRIMRETVLNISQARLSMLTALSDASSHGLSIAELLKWLKEHYPVANDEDDEVSLSTLIWRLRQDAYWGKYTVFREINTGMRYMDNRLFQELLEEALDVGFETLTTRTHETIIKLQRELNIEFKR